MCLIALSWQQHKSFPLVLWANRDEFYHRPTAPLHAWENSDIIAGKDLQEGGTWLGITPRGKWAAVTNYRDPHNIRTDALSRGRLVQQYLENDTAPGLFMEKLAEGAGAFNGFNLLAGTISEAYYFSNYEGVIRNLNPGIYGLSNHLLDTPWPKVTRIKNTFSSWLQETKDLDAAWEILSDNSPAHVGELPDTGVGTEMEKMLSPVCIQTPIYGTRSSSIIQVSDSGEILFSEKDRLSKMVREMRFNII